MKKFAALALLGTIVLAAGTQVLPLFGFGASTTGFLSEATPEEAGLVWRECPIGDLDLRKAETCLGHPLTFGGDAERQNWGKRTGNGMRLSIGNDVYETSLIPTMPFEIYSVYKNGERVKSLAGQFVTYSPDVSLNNIAGKAAWEFSDEGQSTIIYGEQDLRSAYGVEKAYAPYEMAGKLVFIGRKRDKYFFVCDGRKIGPEFDKVIIAYCCEVMLYSPRGAQGRYFFWGTRDGVQYVVDVAAKEPQ